ncbi:MAG: hypothetical protein SH848_09115 [Saprospiraceae bacterium]|nr:hypothetical protein [Saprospiraceae bacterium]MDZ4704077.1 hypothetical protein [Saprospiraceae bacterium]
MKSHVILMITVLFLGCTTGFANIQAVFSGKFSGGNTFTAQAYRETFAMAVPLLQAANVECGSFVPIVRVVAVN